MTKMPKGHLLRCHNAAQRSIRIMAFSSIVDCGLWISDDPGSFGKSIINVVRSFQGWDVEDREKSD